MCLCFGILKNIIRKDPDIELVWLMLSEVVTSSEEKVEALEQAARLNPKNQKTAADHRHDKTNCAQQRYERPGVFR